MQSAAFLVPEITIHSHGNSETLDLGEGSGPVLVTLGVLQVIEQESLLLVIEGSPDGAQWQSEPLVSFSEKFYTGTSAVYIDPARGQIRWLRARWKVNRWGRGDKTPSFRFYLFLEPL